MLSLLAGKRATNILDLRKSMAKRNEENIFKPAEGFGKRSGASTPTSPVNEEFVNYKDDNNKDLYYIDVMNE